MAQSSPIEITFYEPGENGEPDVVRAKFVRSIIPFGILKKAIRFAKSVDVEKLSHLESLADLPEDLADELSSLVVMAFGDRFTPDDLEKYADTGDMIATITNILARAGSSANPTPPAVK